MLLVIVAWKCSSYLCSILGPSFEAYIHMVLMSFASDQHHLDAFSLVMFPSRCPGKKQLYYSQLYTFETKAGRENNGWRIAGKKSMLVNREVQLGLGGEGPSLHRLGHYSSQRWQLLMHHPFLPEIDTARRQHPIGN